MTTAFAFDTAVAIEELVDAGADEQLAKAIVRQFSKVQQCLVTKTDLKVEVVQLRYFIVKNSIATTIAVIGLLKGLQWLGL